MKILKNMKALSPVVASIILIAVTVAVSIAVAAWMGALSFGFMSSGEQLQLGNPWNWATASPCSVYINVTNAGTSTIVIAAGRIDSKAATITAIWLSSGTASLTIPKGDKACVQISNSSAFTAGTQYTFTIITGTNKEFAVLGTAQGN
jgi:flagellin-like protein